MSPAQSNVVKQHELGRDDLTSRTGTQRVTHKLLNNEQSRGTSKPRNIERRANTVPKRAKLPLSQSRQRVRLKASRAESNVIGA